MKEILDFIDQLIEIQHKLDVEYRVFCHSVHKDMKAIGSSPMVGHLEALKELVENYDKELGRD